MKKVIIFLFVFVSIVSCKKAIEGQASTNNNEVENQDLTTNPVVKQHAKSSNILCRINGKDWAYTKASGIVTLHAKTKKHTALITFTKKLEKGSESIQLRYDADSFELEVVSIQLKFPTKEGKLFTCFYDLHPDTRDRYPESELSGTIDLSDPSNASGNAELKNLNIKYEKEKLQNPEDAVISVTGLKFTNIGYSDLDKVAKKLYKK